MKLTSYHKSFTILKIPNNMFIFISISIFSRCSSLTNITILNVVETIERNVLFGETILNSLKKKKKKHIIINLSIFKLLKIYNGNGKHKL